MHLRDREVAARKDTTSPRPSPQEGREAPRNILMIYKPKSKLEKFGEKVFNLLVDNFPQTFYVGGMVRDLLLGKKVTDIDIATSAAPARVVKILSDNNIIHDDSHIRFGVVVAKSGNIKIEIATFRKDLKSSGRYPKVAFVTSLKIDSHRRDFTINALYLSPKSGQILDFHKGLADIKLQKLKFIGNPEKRIKEDPLRIIRALRFARVLNFTIDSHARKAIKKNFYLVKTLTKSRLENELKKLKNRSDKNFVKNAIKENFLLDIN
jgi:tRNA nucleotidyltransferase/poly(A) polymerase